MALESCDIDARPGGGYHLVFRMDAQSPEFFGKYLEVVPGERLVWTNDEDGEANRTITTVTFEAAGETTRVSVGELYPSKAALDEAIESGATAGSPIQLDQLDEFVTAARRA